MTLSQVSLILGMTIVTFLPRFLPVLFLSKRNIPENLVRWMSFVPVSIFSALVFSDVFFWKDTFNVNIIDNLKLLPTLFVFFVAYKTKNMLWSLIAGTAAISMMVFLF